jgi:hypothetical protein
MRRSPRLFTAKLLRRFKGECGRQLGRADYVGEHDRDCQSIRHGAATPRAPVTRTLAHCDTSVLESGGAITFAASRHAGSAVAAPVRTSARMRPGALSTQRMLTRESSARLGEMASVLSSRSEPPSRDGQKSWSTCRSRLVQSSRSHEKGRPCDRPRGAAPCCKGANTRVGCEIRSAATCKKEYLVRPRRAGGQR